MSRIRHPLVAVAGALVLTLPAVGITTAGGGLHHLAPLNRVVIGGLAVLGASFLLAWAAETAEEDVPRAFALAVLAVLAVAPEYAVDAFYAWQAGINAGTPAGVEAGNLAVANMTGANRILIGLGWSGIALFTIWRSYRSGDAAVRDREGILADAVTLDRGITTEIAFLSGATLWAFFVPLFGGIDALDMLILVGLYVTYIGIIIRAGGEAEEEHVGVPAYFQGYPKTPRIAVVLFLFAYSGAMILLAVEPFATGLEALGKQIGVPSFFMIQWIAPLASESPELIVVAYLVNKARSTAGFNALISSKLNQWTLLIGTLVVVHSLALGQYGTLGFDEKQTLEIWLTAAQSFFAMAILVNLEISLREAVGLLVLFVSQVVIEYLILQNIVALPITSHQSLMLFSVIYVALGVVMFLQRRGAVRRLVADTISTAQQAAGRTPTVQSAD